MIVHGIAVSADAQACGYIHAKFEIKNSKGDVIEDAKISLLGRDNDRSILNEASEIAFSKEENAFKLRHGMCSSHYGTRLVVEHYRYVTYEEKIDLPLNSAKNQHIFVVELTEKEIGGIRSSNELFTVKGLVIDDFGSVIPDARVFVDDATNGQFVIDGRSDFEGKFSFRLPAGSYAIKVRVRPFDDFEIERLLVPGNRIDELKFELKCAKCEILECPSGQLEVLVETTPIENLGELRVSPRPIEQMPVPPTKRKKEKSVKIDRNNHEQFNIWNNQARRGSGRECGQDS